ncbi:hypothetical protein [uncultured Lactobacillus sp.]|uniref:hypothetical protein n=1 Tax=uncultured Lactobacillus sp. TaxID=153152 RepID=UPI00260D0A96|nr:hypothetical protein [uncultured Lactobacillus sp.]
MQIDIEQALNRLASNLGTANATLNLKIAKMEVVIESLQSENSELKIKLKALEGGKADEHTSSNTRHK